MRISTSSMVALAFALVIAAPAFADKVPAAPPRATPTPAPAPIPCPQDQFVAGVQARYDRLGGAATFGCFTNPGGVIRNGIYNFQRGQILDVGAEWGTGTTFAVVIGNDGFFHLYWDDVRFNEDTWIVRLSYYDKLVNQVTYDAGGGSVGNNYGSNVIVHPGGRHGFFQIAYEGCMTSLSVVSKSTCSGFETITIFL